MMNGISKGTPYELKLLDGIGPFFKHAKSGRQNWSKIPFDQLPRDGEAFRKAFDEIVIDFETICVAARKWGYNAITLDDLGHLADHAWLESDLRDWIGRLRCEFERLFEIAVNHGLGVYITADVFTASDAIKRQVGNDPHRIHVFLGELVDRFFADFACVDGIIFRVGESDGHDVKDALRSELHVRSARMGNRFLRDLLPVFERLDKKLIFRTWTVGAYPVGDLLWHRTTLGKLLRDIDSPALVLSMKHGDSDFFRYLDTNPNLIKATVSTIVEFQARREYEGAGEFPAFIGEEHARIRDEVASLPHCVGFSTWCQTGGWLPFHRLTFLQPEGIWNEINVAVTSYLMIHPGSQPDEAIRDWCSRSGHDGDPKALCQLLRLSEQVIARLWYVREYAGQCLYFRRVRIPPLMWIYWDSIFVSHPVKRIFKRLVKNRGYALADGQDALEALGTMVSLAEVAGVSREDLEFLSDTGRVLAAARRYFFTPYSEETCQAVRNAKRAYKKKWPRGMGRRRLKVKLSFKRFGLSRRQLALLMVLTLRKRSHYRLLDRMVMLHLLAWGYRVFKKRREKVIPKFARKRAMGLDTVFR